jgi:chromosomal replication initiation ATPase DnaA
MSRAWRIEYAGALYHVLSRGNERRDIFTAKNAQSRDMLLYLIWQLGIQTNQEIGEFFGLTHSAVSRRVSLFKDALKKDAALRQGVDQLKSKIKL